MFSNEIITMILIDSDFELWMKVLDTFVSFHMQLVSSNLVVYNLSYDWITRQCPGCPVPAKLFYLQNDVFSLVDHDYM